jgi:serine protease Do
VSSPPVTPNWVCANSPGCQRFIRARRIPAGFLVLATSILLTTLAAPALAQFPIRQMPGREGSGFGGQGSGVRGNGFLPGNQLPAGQEANPVGGFPPAAATSSPPLPAVARIVVPEKDGVSYGSGTLIDARGQFGLVVSNWHVVRDAAGPITVEFPDGFKSPAEVVKTDKDWDLAALSIYRPKVAAIPITAVAPQPGEMLTIGGYGSGQWRMTSGRCTQYLAPGVDFPHEMVELAAEARQGDSGGPILNQRGELAGVLFGSGPGYTSGSFGGRVLQFLTTVVPGGTPGNDGLSGGTLAADASGGPNGAIRDFNQGFPAPPSASGPTPPQVTALHQSSPVESNVNASQMTPAIKQPLDPLLAPPSRSEVASRIGGEASGFGAAEVDPRVAVSPSQHDLAPTTLPDDGRDGGGHASGSMFTSLEPRQTSHAAATDLNEAEPQELALAIWNRLSGPTVFDQAKTVLAIVGALALVVVFLRFGGEKERYHEAEE